MTDPDLAEADRLRRTARWFTVDRAGVAVLSEATMSHAMDAAMDILLDAGMFDERRVALLVACERAGPDGGPFDGNPEKLARHLVRLNRALRQ